MKMRAARATAASATCVGLSCFCASKYIDYLNEFDDRKRRNYLKDVKTAIVANGGRWSIWDSMCVLTKSWRQHEKHFWNGFGNIELVTNGITKIKTEAPGPIDLTWNSEFEFRKTNNNVVIATRQGKFPSPAFQGEFGKLLPKESHTAHVLLMQPIVEADVNGLANAPSVVCQLGGLPSDEEIEKLPKPGFEGADSSTWTNVSPILDKIIEATVGFASTFGRWRRGLSAVPHEGAHFSKSVSKDRIPLVVLLPSIGENNCKRCVRLAENLVERGCAVILCENPMRGLRAPEGYDGTSESVAEMVSGGYGVVQDSRHLIQHFSILGFERLVIGGLSMGGEMAALCAASLPNTELALVSMMGGDSARPVWTEGCLSTVVHWQSLENDLVKQGFELSKDQKAKRKFISQKLAVVLDDLSGFYTYPGVCNKDLVLQVHSKADGFVLPSSATDLYKQNKGEIRWVPGGHVTGFITKQIDFLDAAVEVIKRLDAKRERDRSA